MGGTQPQNRKVRFTESRDFSHERFKLDRLEGYQWTGRRDDYRWAKVMLKTMLENGARINIDYLHKEAKERDVTKSWNKLLAEIDEIHNLKQKEPDSVHDTANQEEPEDSDNEELGIYR
ncbi:hypothetical protein [uncultured Cloacibacillus sp.]|uniref:hypothetical protein n=1 Tax=uncultured Cloacibacillus sp. TaxID=889794 RepID=UPI0026DD3D1E|nr:hypothetical protein [uncultured Cloacibacillus sp.]